MYKKLYIKTWGCQMNKYDSDKIFFYLNKYNEFVITLDINEANVIILNTCSVREKSQRKLYDKLGYIKKIKTLNSKLIVAVGGCVAVQDKEKIFLKSNIVDIIFGPKSLSKIYFLFKKFNEYGNRIIDINFYYSNVSIIKKTIDSFIYNISIIEGCNKYCSYCIVPFTRGKEISRFPEEIISEINYLSLNGVVEINLLGQNVNAYSSYFSNGKKCSFYHLLNLISDINGIKRIRLITNHPINFNKDLLLAYKNISKIANFLHLPIQSGSDRILKLMKRNYTVNYYKKLIDSILLIRPNMIFSSDFIVGFPSETEDDFILTMNLISEIKFDKSFIFIYSPRPYTKSYYIEDNVSIKLKKYRLNKIKELIYKNSIFWSSSMLGSIQRVLVEKKFNFRNNICYGRTDSNRLICFFGDRKFIGTFVYVKVIDFSKNFLYGYICK